MFQLVFWGEMDTQLLIFIFVSVLMAVIFGFSLLLLKRDKKVPGQIVNYNVDAAVKLAELEGHVNSLRLEFTEVIDRIEKWTKRDTQRDKRIPKPSGDVLPTDADLVQGNIPLDSGFKTGSVFARLRAAKGR